MANRSLLSYSRATFTALNFTPSVPHASGRSYCATFSVSDPTYMELIPAIDLKEGRCVRLFKGNFDAETVYSNEPETVLERYRALGARRVHVVDLDGARD